MFGFVWKTQTTTQADVDARQLHSRSHEIIPAHFATAVDLTTRECFV